MTILRAGTFKVSDLRKAIPQSVRQKALLRAGLPPDSKGIHIDHRPPLCDRDYDTEAGDFIPPQHSLDHLEAIKDLDEHYRRTFGRAPGALKTVTTRGSDVGERTRTRDIRASEQRHRENMERKARGEPKPPSRWPKRSFGRKERANG